MKTQLKEFIYYQALDFLKLTAETTVIPKIIIIVKIYHLCFNES